MFALAKAVKDHEFVYNIRSVHKVSKRSGQLICDELNRTRWNLKDGEVWHMYELDEYSQGYDLANVQQFRIRKGVIYQRTPFIYA